MRNPTENEKNRALLDAFMDASGKSLRTIAGELSAVAMEPNGKTITKDRVNNYRIGRAEMPEWFLEGMDRAYPGWRAKSIQQTGRQIETSTVDNEGLMRRRDMPVIPSIGDPDMKKALDQLSNGDDWIGRLVPAPDFFNMRLPMQFVRSSKYAPAFLPGDALLLDTDAEAAIDSIYLVYLDGEFVYAALKRVSDAVAWVKYDGTVVPFDQGVIEASLVAYLPQFEEGRDEGLFARRGLKSTWQITWPRPVA